MWVVISIIVLLLSLTLVLSFPSVQTAVAQYAVSWVNKNYDTRIELEKMRYIFPDQIALKEVYLPDERGDTMIYASDIDLHIHGFNSLTNTAYSTGVTVDNLKFYWVMQPGESEYNFQKFIDKFRSSDTISSKPFNLQIADIEVNNGIYRYEDLNCDSCFAFFLKDLNIEVSDFDLQGQYLTMEVESLSGHDEYSLDIQSFETYFEYQADHISFDDLEFTTAASHFEGNVSLNYQEMSDFRDFVNEVTMVGEIDKSTLSSREIQYFGEEMPDFGVFSISGSVEGIVNDMKIRNVVLDLADNTHAEGDIDLRNTTTLENIFMKVQNFDLHTNPEDAQFVYGLFSDTTLPEEINPLGSVHVSGNFNGYLNNFNTQARIVTDQGTVETDIYLYIPKGNSPSEYRGKVVLEAVDLGKILGDTTLGTVTSNLSIDGSGFDPPTMNTKLKGQVNQLEYNNYAYRNISINGKVSNGNFNGSLDINDPNLKFDFNGTASFQKDTSTYDFAANIKMADLHALNFVDDTISVATGEVSMDFVAVNYNKWA